jgi:hypothetical protein
MVETYKITAVPTLYAEGEHKGKLKGVTFIATAPDDRMQWFTKNCGQFEAAFSKIIAPNLSKLITVSLMQGDEVEFPGRYTEDQFARGFMFEWSPVYLVTPPQFAYDC